MNSNFTNDFFKVVLDEYKTIESNVSIEENEADIEKAVIETLKKQGYEYLGSGLKSDDLLRNLRRQIERLNGVTFNEGEWKRLYETYICLKSESQVDKSRKLHNGDEFTSFKFDNGESKNIFLIKKREDKIDQNILQVINQYNIKSGREDDNKLDLTLLVNGLPLVQFELKKRSVHVNNAIEQIERYSKESFSHEQEPLFKYIQIFIVSNGYTTKYHPNKFSEKSRRIRELDLVKCK
jgi:type I restriction enzyme R subunit